MVAKVTIPKVNSSKGGTSLEEVTGEGKVPSKPGKEAMRTVTESAEIFQLMEARDEQQMMQEIMGVYAKEYVYDIPFKGGKISKCDTPDCPLAKRGEPHTHVRGLSWSGVKEARRIFKGIDTRQLSHPVVVEQDGKKFYESSATAVDLRTGNCTTVYKRQPFLKKKKSGEYITDEFAYEIVQSKAKRNAIAEILPQPLVRAWIQDWVQGKKDFNPKTVVDLKVGEYSVEDEQPEDKGQQKLTGAKAVSTPQLNLIYAGFREIEKLGGRPFDASLAEWKKYFGVNSFKALSLVQASKIIKTNISNVAKLKNVAQLNKERTEREAKEAAEKENQDLLHEESRSPDRAKTLRAIRDALAELGWDTKDESLIQTLLSPYNLKSIQDLESADISVLQKILNDVGGGGAK